MLSPEQKKALRVAKILDKGEFAMVEELDAIDAEFEVIKDDISTVKEELTSKVDEALVIANETKKMKGDKGDSPTEEELLGLIAPLIPEVKNGEDYILTEKDKKQIAQSIKVPIVEQIIERTEVIKEQPIVTEITNNVENKDTGEQIIDKINLDQTSLIDFSKIDTEPFDRQFNAFKKDVLNIPRGGGAVGGSSTTSGTPSPLTTKGDLYGFSTVDARIPVGTNGKVLTADSTDTNGVSWQTPSGGVTSVTATDSTLTISPTTGAVLAGINLSSANTWTALETFDTALGTEKVTNGTPPSASGWTLGAAWSYSSNSFVKGIDGTNTVSQNVNAVAGESYQVVYEIFNRTVGSLTPTLGGTGLTLRSANGTYTESVTTSTTGNLIFTPTNTARLSIRLISVKKIADGGAKVTNTYTATALYPSPTSAPVWWHTTAWKSNATAAAQNQDFIAELRGITNATTPTSEWVLKTSRNNGTYSDALKLAYSGKLTTNIRTGIGEITGYEISAQFGNSTLGTTEHIKLSNSAQYTWTSYYFTGTLKGGYGYDSSGNFTAYGTGADYKFYNGLTSSSLLFQIYGGGTYNNGGSFNAGRVTAGSAVTSPPSTFTNYGSTGLQTVNINTPTTLTDAYTSVMVDCSSYNICSGTPSVTDCTTYTGSGQATCESHLPCAWYAGDSCSAFDNEYGMATCSGTSGCSASTSSCAPYAYDQTVCEAADDTYGGNCSWSAGTNTCPSQDCSTCAGAGCTLNNSSDCSAFSDGGGDGTACYAAPCGACSYDSGSGVCSGYYFTSCDGDNATPSCSGDWYTGSCAGVYNVSCSGTATCSGYGDSSACTGEAGCSWTSGVPITMPANPVERLHLIGKKNTSGLLTILPNSGQTINYTTSITSSSTAGVGWVLGWVEADSNWHVYAKN